MSKLGSLWIKFGSYQALDWQPAWCVCSSVSGPRGTGLRESILCSFYQVAVRVADIYYLLTWALVAPIAPPPPPARTP